MIGKGWEQIEAGLGLINWSGLASWDGKRLTLVAASRNDFESHVSTVHGRFGRLICWIAFSAGSEYVVRGAFAVKGHCPVSTKPTIRPPRQDEKISHWIKVAKEGDAKGMDPSFFELDIKEDLKFGGSLPWSKILKSGGDQDLVSTSISLLAGKVRNRDAHRYTKNVRDPHFHVVERLFVPAINIILAALDQHELNLLRI